MQDVVIVAAARTPVGKIGGSIKDVSAQDLAAVVFQELLQRARLAKDQVDLVILGQARQSTDAANIARVAALKSDIPVSVPAYTVHSQCASGLQAIVNGWKEIVTGDATVVLAGGTESMSQAPYYLKRARFGYVSGDGALVDANTEGGPGSQPQERYGILTMGMTAENLAEKYSISRREQDEFALSSQEKALAAIKKGIFIEEIVAVTVKSKKTTTLFTVDEHPRETSLELLAKLPPAFKQGGSVTAGNSSGRNDGAAAVVLTTAEKARGLGLKPMAKLISAAMVGVSPEIMGIGPVYAIEMALKKASLSLEDIGLIEINEAFAAQILAVLKELEISPADERLNVNGGAIALGHPVGCSGARLTTSLLYEMQRRDVRYGLVSLCAAGGQGIAAVLEKL